MSHDWQQIVALLIVAVAAVAVIRRLLGQLRGFRTPRRRSAPPAPAKPAESPLLQIQLKPPVHLKRPPQEGP